MSKLSFNGKRVVLGVWLLLCMFFVANYYLDIGVVGRFGKQAVILSFVVLALLQHFVGPSLSEVREYRERLRRQEPPR
jgi:hypothetical protein